MNLLSGHILATNGAAGSLTEILLAVAIEIVVEGEGKCHPHEAMDLETADGAPRAEDGDGAQRLDAFEIAVIDGRLDGSRFERHQEAILAEPVLGPGPEGEAARIAGVEAKDRNGDVECRGELSAEEPAAGGDEGGWRRLRLSQAGHFPGDLIPTVGVEGGVEGGFFSGGGLMGSENTPSGLSDGQGDEQQAEGGEGSEPARDFGIADPRLVPIPRSEREETEEANQAPVGENPAAEGDDGEDSDCGERESEERQILILDAEACAAHQGPEQDEGDPGEEVCGLSGEEQRRAEGRPASGWGSPAALEQECGPAVLGVPKQQGSEGEERRGCGDPGSAPAERRAACGDGEHEENRTGKPENGGEFGPGSKSPGQTGRHPGRDRVPHVASLEPGLESPEPAEDQRTIRRDQGAGHDPEIAGEGEEGGGEPTRAGRGDLGRDPCKEVGGGSTQRDEAQAERERSREIATEPGSDGGDERNHGWMIDEAPIEVVSMQGVIRLVVTQIPGDGQRKADQGSGRDQPGEALVPEAIHSESLGLERGPCIPNARSGLRGIHEAEVLQAVIKRGRPSADHGENRQA